MALRSDETWKVRGSKASNPHPRFPLRPLPFSGKENLVEMKAKAQACVGHPSGETARHRSAFTPQLRTAKLVNARRAPLPRGYAVITTKAHTPAENGGPERVGRGGDTEDRGGSAQDARVPPGRDAGQTAAGQRAATRAGAAGGERDGRVRGPRRAGRRDPRGTRAASLQSAGVSPGDLEGQPAWTPSPRCQETELRLQPRQPIAEQLMPIDRPHKPTTGACGRDSAGPSGEARANGC